jgi:hypothetical protein
MNKVTIILTVLIALTLKTNSQISNNGFENWTAASGYNDPSDWATVNSYSTGSFYAVTKSTDHYPVNVGDYSARIENNTAFPNDIGRGIIMSGTFAGAGGASFPITGHPTSLTGYYKFAPLNNDTMYINIHLFKNGSEVAYGKYTSTASTSNWTPFTISFSQSYTSTDSGSIIIAAYNADGPNNVPHGNSILYVDNLNFDNLITTATCRNLKIFNPVSDIVNLFNPSLSGVSFTLPFNSRVSLKVLDLRGREAATLVNNETMSAGTYTRRWNAGAMSSGVYVYRLRAGSSTVTIKAFR